MVFLCFIWNLKSRDDNYMRLTYVLKKNCHGAVYKGCLQKGHGFLSSINLRTHLQHACS